MDMRARLDRLQQRVTPQIRGMRVILHNVDGSIASDRVIIPGQPARSCAPEEFPHFYPHGEIVSQIILEYADEPARNSLLAFWLDAEPHGALGPRKGAHAPE